MIFVCIAILGLLIYAVFHQSTTNEKVTPIRMAASIMIALSILAAVHVFIRERKIARSTASKIMHHQTGVQQRVAVALRNRR
ncbi:hypothetical protein [Siphonobacter sp. SORGH_AS_1065]|uniref:hypothetical protein n=1 Tax=Siphonobacter sp. SORGH_AS_1065 TaxID=3041795 RepID=UPI00277DCBEB|nr:hypothetical protein [Siphonobacter sp. SORGH_AS_1065]MDQ1088906.1 hypothetical protein [Siphonobacter sp. SORGH_AS_1065]